MNVKVFFVIIASVFFISACEDMGDPVSAPSTPTPTITSLLPDSGSVGDTISIKGINFTPTKGSVKFGSIAADTIVSWSDTLILVKVPASAITGNLVIIAGGKSSNAKQFKVLGTSAPVLSFSTDIKPLLNSYGCSGCHGVNGGLSVSSVASLLAGGNHGPAIVVNNADNSNLVKKLRESTLPFGAKMPANGGNVTDTDLQKIKDWINQGANN